MDDVVQWLLQISWIDLAVGTVAGLAAAGLLTSLAFHLGRRAEGDGGGAARATLEERRRLLLFCGDAKVLADLAIQRSMLNPEFLRYLQAQPCHAALLPQLSEEFLSLTAQQTGARSPTVATAFRKDVERLEREWSATSARHFAYPELTRNHEA